MGRRTYSARIPKDLYEKMKEYLDYISKNAEDKKDKAVCRQILRKVTLNYPLPGSSLDYTEVSLGPQEARTYDDIVGILEYPESMKTRQVIG